MRQSGTPIRVMVTGSRVWEDAYAIYDDLNVLRANHGPSNVTLIHGANGAADFMADGFGQVFGFNVERFPADWKTYGKGAGMRRNREMLDTRPDLVLAYPLGRSPGTRGAMAEASKRGIIVQSQEPISV